MEGSPLSNWFNRQDPLLEVTGTRSKVRDSANEVGLAGRFSPRKEVSVPDPSMLKSSNEAFWIYVERVAALRVEWERSGKAVVWGSRDAAEVVAKRVVQAYRATVDRVDFELQGKLLRDTGIWLAP